MAYKGTSKYPELGGNIRKLRKYYGYTQKRFADYIKVTNQSVSAWESGLADPRQEQMDSILEFFKVSKFDLCYNKVMIYQDDNYYSFAAPYKPKQSVEDTVNMYWCPEDPSKEQIIEEIADNCKQLNDGSLQSILELTRMLSLFCQRLYDTDKPNEPQCLIVPSLEHYYMSK